MNIGHVYPMLLTRMVDIDMAARQLVQQVNIAHVFNIHSANY